MQPQMKEQWPKTKVKSKPCGFTVAELLAVIVLIALIGSVGGGIYVGTHRKLLAEKAARDIVLAAKYARIMAIEKQRPYMMEFDTVNNGFQLTCSSLGEQTEAATPMIVRDVYFKPVQFGGDVKFEDIKIAPIGSQTEVDVDEQTGIVFQPNGTAQLAVIQVGDGKNHFTVSITAATGKAKMYSGTAENVKVTTVDLDAQE
jgi:Tfp pilus assembly protein FimT